jgi:iron complex outermembrane recepter protein
LFLGTEIRVGISSLAYPFPAPTGIVDYRLRPAGHETVISTVLAAGPFDGGGADLDLQLSLGSTLSLAGGVSFRRFADQPGGDGADLLSIGLAPVWRPSGNVEVRAFWGSVVDPNDITTPYVFVAGPYLPPRFRRRSFAQRWTGWDARIGNYGLVGRANTGQWRVDAGVSRANLSYDESYNDLYLDTDPAGLARRHVINIYPRTADRTTAGEVRVSRQLQHGAFRHLFYATFRGFLQDRSYGGAAAVDFGATRIGQRGELTRPAVALGTPSRDDVRQWTAGVGYHGRWSGVGEINLGLQRADYRKTTLAPARPPIVAASAPWLWNGAIGLELGQRLGVYASYTRGLEESPVAPEIAVNRSEAPPAILTTQWDAGFRYLIHGSLRLVAGLFDIRKPYFNLDRNLVYGRLGTVRHSGIELSLSGEPAEGLNVVGGAVFLRSRLSGEAVEQGLIGPRPVGQTGRTLRLDLDYRPRRTSPFSIDLSLIAYGARTASQDNLLEVPAVLLVDIGGRYRLNIGGNRATLRLLIENVTNRFSWTVSSAGGFVPSSNGVQA